MLHNFSYGAFGDGGRPQSFGYTGRWGGYTDERLGQVLNWHRWYGPAAGRWGSRDPIGIVGGPNLFVYGLGNPGNLVDPDGLKVWNCRRPLGKKPGSKGPPVVYHRYICVQISLGKIECYGQTTVRGILWGKDRATTEAEDYFDENSCDLVDDDADDCLENCIASRGREKYRPRYGIGPQATDCQEWSDDLLKDCQKQCEKRAGGKK